VVLSFILMRLAWLLPVVLAVAACASPAPISGQAPASGTAASGAQPAGPATSPGAESTVGLEVGQRAPAFSVIGIDGRQYPDSDLKAQGKPYILYFYATW